MSEPSDRWRYSVDELDETNDTRRLPELRAPWRVILHRLWGLLALVVGVALLNQWVPSPGFSEIWAAGLSWEALELASPYTGFYLLAYGWRKTWGLTKGGTDEE